MFILGLPGSRRRAPCDTPHVPCLTSSVPLSKVGGSNTSVGSSSRLGPFSILRGVGNDSYFNWHIRRTWVATGSCENSASQSDCRPCPDSKALDHFSSDQCESKFGRIYEKSRTGRGHLLQINSRTLHVTPVPLLPFINRWHSVSSPRAGPCTTGTVVPVQIVHPLFVCPLSCTSPMFVGGPHTLGLPRMVCRCPTAGKVTFGGMAQTAADKRLFFRYTVSFY